AKLRRARIDAGERLRDQLASQLHQRHGMLVRRVDEDVAVVEPLATAVVVELPVKVNDCHDCRPLLLRTNGILVWGRMPCIARGHGARGLGPTSASRAPGRIPT